MGELGVFYGFDSPKGVTYANALDLKALGVGRDELRKLAIANYRRLYRKLGVERLQPTIFLVVEGGVSWNGASCSTPSSGSARGFPFPGSLWPAHPQGTSCCSLCG